MFPAIPVSCYELPHYDSPYNSFNAAGKATRDDYSDHPLTNGYLLTKTTIATHFLYLTHFRSRSILTF